MEEGWPHHVRVSSLGSNDRSETIDHFCSVMETFSRQDKNNELHFSNLDFFFSLMMCFGCTSSHTPE